MVNPLQGPIDPDIHRPMSHEKKQVEKLKEVKIVLENQGAIQD